MALLLNIDTAVSTASIALSDQSGILAFCSNDLQKDHASWLHLAIQELLNSQQVSMKDLEAVAVSMGPGSYTGLRVGLSSAKGLCFALNIPLIAISTLEMMAAATQHETTGLLCPMIDARRMEVFTAVYTADLLSVLSPSAMILDQNSFGELLTSHTILFSGNGAHKMQSLASSPNAHFSSTQASSKDLAPLAQHHFTQRKFADLAYSEPFYVKEFYSTANQ